jgi:6-phosphogluconolactonase
MAKPRHLLNALAAIIAVLILAPTAVLADQGHDRGDGGFVYVNNNSAGTNAVSAFRRHHDGRLSPVAGSPFATGGAGTGAPVATQGAVQLALGGRFLLVVNPGSNEISSFKVKRDGHLQLVGAAPSHGVAPGSLTVRGSLVYVANTGPVGANYTGFWLGRNGRLYHLPWSTYRLPADAYPGEVLLSPDGRQLIGIRTGGTATQPTIGPSLIDSFRVGFLGSLRRVEGSPFASQRIGPIGAAFSPKNASQLFVTNAHDGPGLGSVSGYWVGHWGRVTPIDGSPFANDQTATCWIDITRDGRTMVVVNTGTPSLSTYRISHDGSLELQGSVGFRAAMAPFDVGLSPNDRFAYVVDAAADVVHGFSLEGGTLTELPGSPTAVPGAGAAFGIAVS